MYGYKWLEQPIKGVLLNVNGVLRDNTNSAICGSVLGFETLLGLGLPYRLVTNETTMTRKQLTASLRSLGFTVTEKYIISPIPVLINILKKGYMRPHLLVHEQVIEEFSSIDLDEVNCVVIGDAEYNFSYSNLNDAFRILMDMPMPRLFSLGIGKYHKGKHGLNLNVGTFTKALEFATGVKPTVVGKPTPEYFLTAVQDMGLKPEDVVMIGDDLEMDIIGAQACGMRGIIVGKRGFMNFDLDVAAHVADGVVRNLYEAMQLISVYTPRK